MNNLSSVHNGQVAQLVEQWTENPRVGGSIPPLATKKIKGLLQNLEASLLCLCNSRVIMSRRAI